MQTHECIWKRTRDKIKKKWNKKQMYIHTVKIFMVIYLLFCTFTLRGSAVCWMYGFDFICKFFLVDNILLCCIQNRTPNPNKCTLIHFLVHKKHSTAAYVVHCTWIFGDCMMPKLLLSSARIHTLFKHFYSNCICHFYLFT